MFWHAARIPSLRRSRRTRRMEEESWEQLCLAIMKESDPHRLLQLVIKLNSALQQRETELQRVHLNSPMA
jgi:hypothetical protein